MASASRWRRFAFFDRCTLSLPDDVWDDLVHPNTTANSTKKKKGVDDEQEYSNEQQQGHDESEEEEDEGTTTTTTSAATTTRVRHRLVFTCASVSFHPSLLPAYQSTTNSNSTSSSTEPQPQPFFPEALLRHCSIPPTTGTTTTTTTTAAAAAATNTNNSTVTLCTSTCGVYNKNTTFLSTNTTTTSAAAAAATPPTLSPINGSLAFVYCFPDNQQPISPVLEKVAQHFFASCVQPQQQRQPNYPEDSLTTTAQQQQQQQQQQISVWNAAANRLGVGTLVLAFLSSQDTPLLHVVDLSMRCNPPTLTTTTTTTSTSAATANTTTTTTNALADQLSAVSMEELEDLDGWRGCINPFPPYGKKIACMASYSTSNSSSINQIYSLDSTTKQPSSANNNHLFLKHREDLGHLYVAVVSNDTIHSTTTMKEDVASGNHNNICILVDPHLYLQPNISAAVATTTNTKLQHYPKAYRLNTAAAATTTTTTNSPPLIYTCVDIVPPLLVVGTSTGTTLLYSFTPLEQLSKHPQQQEQQQQRLELILRMEIPSPADGNETVEVKSVKLSHDYGRKEDTNQSPGYPKHIFVCYRRRRSTKKHSTLKSSSGTTSGAHRISSTTTSNSTTAGVCCYTVSFNEKQPRSRIDLDSREISNKLITDCNHEVGQFQICWSDGLYTYSPSSKVGIVQPIDGRKIAFCRIPSSDIPTSARRQDTDELLLTEQPPPQKQIGEQILVATSDNKSGRDAIDIYDTTNKLCAFHVLLSPNHRAIQVGGVTTPFSNVGDGGGRRGRSSAVVVTSGGAVVTLTEKDTYTKVASLLQKNLFAAAISLAFADSYYTMSDVIILYRQYAEHLYRKGDFEASMDQYIYTIGSLEPSYVIFRFLDAPKIPLLVKYLEQFLSRSKNNKHSMANVSQITELLRTCYLKLNDLEAAEKIITTSSALSNNVSSAIANLVMERPAEALATLCSLEAPQVAEALSVHGAALARSLPRETAGIVMSLCDGTYSPTNLDSSNDNTTTENNLFMENRKQKCDRYPVSMFTSAFIENPKLLRLLLAHCKRNHCEILPSLRRTHLELTLEEWNAAKRNGDDEMEMIRSEEAMTALTDSYAEELGAYEALVIVQMAGFTKGEVLLFERLQMPSMLLERYAKEGGERERRQMLAMCCSDPELLADVLSYFVAMASQNVERRKQGDDTDDDSQSEVEDVYADIKEALEMARSQGVLSPVRVARILAGEGPGQFSSDSSGCEVLDRPSVPLSVALKYIGGILDESSQKILRLKEDLKEYCTACNAMEAEIASLLAASSDQAAEDSSRLVIPNFNINELCAKVRENTARNVSGNMDTFHAQEEFWREMGQSSDRYDTIARFFGKLSIA